MGGVDISSLLFLTSEIAEQSKHGAIPYVDPAKAQLAVRLVTGYMGALGGLAVGSFAGVYIWQQTQGDRSAGFTAGILAGGIFGGIVGFLLGSALPNHEGGITGIGAGMIGGAIGAILGNTLATRGKLHLYQDHAHH